MALSTISCSSRPITTLSSCQHIALLRLALDLQTRSQIGCAPQSHLYNKATEYHFTNLDIGATSSIQRRVHTMHKNKHTGPPSLNPRYAQEVTFDTTSATEKFEVLQASSQRELPTIEIEIHTISDIMCYTKIVIEHCVCCHANRGADIYATLRVLCDAHERGIPRHLKNKTLRHSR